MTELGSIYKTIATVKKIRESAEKFELGIGEKVRKIRLLKGLSGRAFARQIGISAQYLCDVEKGQRRLSKRVLNEIAKLKS